MRRLRTLSAALSLLACFCLSALPGQAETSFPDRNGPPEDLISSKQNVCAQDAALTSVKGELLSLNTEYYRLDSSTLDLCDIDGWTIYLSAGFPSGVDVECESGGQEDCPLLNCGDDDEEDDSEDDPQEEQ